MGHTTLTAPPSFWKGYRVALFSGRHKPKLGEPIAALPALSVTLTPQQIDVERLAAYRRVCGFADGATLPITYPQVLAGGLHLSLMADPLVPYPLLGVVHVRNQITQTKAIPASAPLGLTVRFGESKAVRRGVEFALHTEASVEGEVCWRAETNVLVPGVGKVEKRAEAAGEVATEPVRSLTQEWTVPADQGRRYAKVSGDYNPIHLTALTARPFGFPRAIVHGMWTLARASAALHEETVGRGGAWTLTCAFKKPLLLPSRVQFASGTEQGGTEAGPGGGGGVGFEVKDSKGAQLIVGNLAGALAQATGA